MSAFTAGLTLLLVTSTLWTQVSAQCSAGTCQLLDNCNTDSDCAPGLICSSCVVSGVLQPICIRDQATVLQNITSLPFNKVAWLTTHNSFAIVGAPELTGPRITFYNQEDSVTDQLNNGVRGLMLDMYDYKNDVWLCHSFDGECLDITSFAPALDTVKEIMTFLVNNPSEIVTLFIEDYVSAVNGISNVFRAAGINQYLFPLASMPAPGADWPTVGTMIQNNWRLVVFTSKSSKQATEGIAYQWNFVDENQYGDDGLVAGLCPNRAESQFMNSTRNSLILQNYFHTNPVQDTTCRDNSQALYDELTACYTASANRWANFLSVDFYKRSTGGGAFQAVDKLNGQMQCGCNSPVSCQTQTAPGICPADV
ncbi:hypothetical protein MPTK1_1g11610 [Marchantia polymorpha subsp. ruderalis]|uniref:Phosphatidylinositol-specific phospholipase C X domain-containing protein n=2 Tax=Marchantia polymorpha TaxID=3197 RepID=A0AAF6AP26_MARPO|nr:hypothetical protein MARPO_0014s0065 [Marchantia polymorpha]BBM98196.1 hypothetical protein Mp_1g11610 [Marchantia polymorpha subsp. ruderalis]|eukprot:PTQ45525.1 hypothetical protein MARPO_0014s0065 [Marchantia polymorpha]